MRFEFHSTDKGFRKGILFLSGRGKSIESWNITSTGKIIDLEKCFRERTQTCLVEFEENDLVHYFRAQDTGIFEEDLTMNELISAMNPTIKWIVVASSLGGYFASILSRFSLGMILIDSVTVLAKCDYKIPLRVHLKMTREVTPNFEFWNKVSAYHAYSAVIVHWDSSHLIHWDYPEKIRVSIEYLLKTIR